MRRNKKLLITVSFLILLLFLVSCNTKRSNGKKELSSSNTYVTKNEAKNEEEILLEFNKIVSEGKEPYHLAKFIDENIQKVSKDNASGMIEKFEKNQEDYIDTYSDELFIDNRQVTINKIYEKGTLDVNKIDTLEDEYTKELLRKILEGKYKIVNKEEGFYPIIDYNKLKDYSKFLSEEMNGYIEIKSIESERPFLISTSLVITWDELSERLIGIEKYLRKYPESIKLEELLRLYGEYLLTYLEGAKDTPNYDVETKVFYDDVIESYRKLIANNKNSITKDILEKYLTILEENDNKMNKEVEGKVVDLYNEAISRLEEL